MEKGNNKNISSELNNLKVPKRESSSGNELLQFFIGVILLGVGLFMLTKRVTVHSSWYIWRIGNFDLSSGMITIPLIIGIIWYFFDSKSYVPKVIITLSVIFIIITIIMSVRINFMVTSMFNYILIFGMIAAGSGLLLRTLFKKRD
ncbi:MAG TPA: hypothetical protein IAB70_05690 [Candidatus Merdicola faecigallinarum]|uniref:Uncharacterized protein n=1 Tax=Candidatus Merdicola faecigallinarum TaxID=2840862 RepID=A0A9D1SA61_9FIRM|nr:hypothetical protein [Candidatus Merdicola faecigallinarum]